MRVSSVGFRARAASSAVPGANPGRGTVYHPTALPTVGLYALPAPGFVPGAVRAHPASEEGGAIRRTGRSLLASAYRGIHRLPLGPYSRDIPGPLWWS